MKATPNHTHDCPCGCGTQVNHNLVACRPGWALLPAEYRTAILNARRGERLGAVSEALTWYRNYRREHGRG